MTKNKRFEYQQMEGRPDVSKSEVTSQSKEKRCAACKKFKSIEDFGVDRHTKDGLSVYCFPCAREQIRVRVRKYREKKKEERQKALQKEIEALGGICQDCGYNKIKALKIVGENLLLCTNCYTLRKTHE